jgi:hypothetical protein
MTRWTTMAISLVVIAGVGIAAEELYGLADQHYKDIQTQQAQLTLQVSDLNDRLIAVTRGEKPASETAASDSTAAADASASDAAIKLSRHWLRQTLLLAQTQLDQTPLQLTQQLHTLSAAEVTLNQVKQALPLLAQSQSISTLTQSALERAIDADLHVIDDQGQKQAQANQNLDRKLADLQLQLDRMARVGPSLRAAAPPANPAKTTPSDNTSFLGRVDRLFIIEKPALDVRSNMLQRALICREVALTLGLARQALAGGQADRVRQLLADSRDQLAGIVDPDARQTLATLTGLTVAENTKLQLSALQWMPADPLPQTPINPLLVPAPVAAAPTARPASAPVVAQPALSAPAASQPVAQAASTSVATS